MQRHPIIRYVFRQESSRMVKDNVLVICQLVFLIIFLIIYNVLTQSYTAKHIPAVTGNVFLVMFAAWQWWQIKKHDRYYPFILFAILLPFFLWLLYRAILDWGQAGALWSFPFILLLYFCLSQSLALFASVTIYSLAVVMSFAVLPSDFAFRLAFSLLIVMLGCGWAFYNSNKQNLQLEKQASIDPLTGAYNRMLLQSSLEEAILNKNRRVGDVFPCILCIDADHFKRINDTYGHHMGDKALVHLAETLSNGFDHPKDKLFRMGGEEFLLLKHFRSHDAIASFAENMRASVAALSLFPDGRSMTVSMGVATIKDYFEQTQTDMVALNDAGESAYASRKQRLKQWNHWIKLADDAMYQAKAAGRNCVVYAHESS